jgi:hypothetical protein
MAGPAGIGVTLNGCRALLRSRRRAGRSWESLSARCASALAQLDRMVEQAFVRVEFRHCIYFEEHPARLLELLKDFDPTATHKWIDLDTS